MKNKWYKLIGALALGIVIAGGVNMQEIQAETNVSQEAENVGEENSWRYFNGQLVSDYISTYSENYTTWPQVTGAVAKGIDVSHHQGVIDWAKVKAAGVDYAIIRCGYGMDDPSQDDKYFKQNVQGCIQNNIPFGVYLYSYADTIERAYSEAQHVLRLISGYNLTYPVYYDLEENSVRNSVSKDGIAQIATAFCDTIQKAGYEVGVYANLDWFDNYLTNACFDKWDRWIAQWNTECTYQKNYAMWQCSSSGIVNGINGRVDLNLDFGTVKDQDAKLVVIDGVTYCYKGNQQVFGEQKIDGKWYCFDSETGKMITGFYDLPGKRVYYGSDGTMRYNEQKIDGKWYHFNSVTGKMTTGFWKLPTKTVYYGSDGTMRYNEQKINGKWYHFHPVTGAMTTGFYNLPTKKVYYGSDGVMRYNEQKINGKWYHFHPVTGAMTTGFYNLPGKKVYYGNDGAMRYNEQKINGKWYHFNSVTGKMTTGFYNLPTKKVYYGSDGVMRYGQQKINGRYYYFHTITGALIKSW